MAITALEHFVLTSFAEHGGLPTHPRVLELGESNWYGDVPAADLEKDIYRLIHDPGHREIYLEQLKQIIAGNRPGLLYELARFFYDVVLQPGDYAAIDPGTPTARYRYDLNLPVPLREQFDMVLNIGTAEHIFNVHQFFQTVHERTITGGIMMHSSPFTGWLDHGLFNFQPTFFFDLARENGYEMISCICGRISPFQYVQVFSHDEIPHLIKAKKIPDGSHINVLLRKTNDAGFKTPTQAYYAGALSEESRKMWMQLR